MFPPNGRRSLVIACPSAILTSNREYGLHAASGCLAMTRRGFHILLALALLICVMSPFVEEFVLHWNQSIFDNGCDGESTVAVIALVVLLAFALAKFLALFVPEGTTEEPLVHSRETVSLSADIAACFPDTSPPLALRI